jgi:pimeloyl-ACP methyl ester carboxylesterase
MLNYAMATITVNGARLAYDADGIASRHTFADAGHIPHRTHPEEFARVVAAFLDDVP